MYNGNITSLLVLNNVQVQRNKRRYLDVKENYW